MSALAEMNGRKRSLALVLMAITLVGPEQTQANDPAVAVEPTALYVSTHGDDHNDGSSLEKPLRSVSKAISLAGPNATVYVDAGRYFEQLVTRRAGAQGAEITIKSFKGTVVIDGSALKWAPGRNQNRAIVELRHPFVKLVGLEIAHSKNTGILLDADDLTVESCHVTDTRLHAISTDTARQTTNQRNGGGMIKRLIIRNNLIERAVLGGNGQAISLIADGFVVSGNTVRNSPKEGIDIWLGARRGEVVGNRVYGNAAAGIYVDGAAYVKIHRNIVYRNRAGIGISSEDSRYSTRDVWVFNNILYDNSESVFFLWDNLRRPGRNGVQNILIAHNTSIGSNHVLYLSGKGNTVRILNNLGYATDASVLNDATRSSLIMEGNVWLDKVDGFVAAGQQDFRLAGASVAIDKGVNIPPLTDGRGGNFSISEDFDGMQRVAGGMPDAGAFEYSGQHGH